MDEMKLYDTVEAQEGFVIDNDSKADWAARVVKEEAEERDRLLALVKAERERLDAKEEEIRRRYEQKTEYLTGQLLSYMTSVKTRNTATQSTYALLNAKLVYKCCRRWTYSRERGLWTGWRRTDLNLSK